MRKLLLGLLFFGFTSAFAGTYIVSNGGTNANWQVPAVNSFSWAYNQAVASPETTDTIILQVNVDMAGTTVQLALDDLTIVTNGPVFTINYGFTAINATANRMSMIGVTLQNNFGGITLSGTDLSVLGGGIVTQGALNINGNNTTIQTANLSGGTIVNLGGANTNITDTPLNTNNATVTQSGANSTFTNMPFVASVFNIPAGGANSSYIGGDITIGTISTLSATDVTFRELRFNTAATNFEIRASRASFIRVDVSHTNNQTPGLYFTTGTSNHLIDSCTFDNNFWFGNVAPLFERPDNSLISNSTFAFDLSVEGNDNTVRNCIINRTAILGNTQGGWPNYAAYRSRFVSCTIGQAVSNTESRVIIVGYDNEVDSCTFNGKCVVLLGERNRVEDNFVNIVSNPNQDDANVNTGQFFNTQAGIQIQTDPAFYDNIAVGSTVIKNNVLRTTLNITATVNINGIRVIKGSQNDTIVGNDVTGFWNGILFRQTNGNSPTGTYVADNYTYRNFIDGLRSLGSNDITFRDNKSFENGENGLHIEGENGVNSTNNQAVANFFFSNLNAGVLIDNNATSNLVDSNSVGLDTLGIPNTVGQDYGIRIATGANSNLIGSISPNIIVANTEAGININGATANEIYNNLIGNVLNTNAALENDGPGVLVENGARSNLIGDVGQGNTIAYKTSTDAAIQIDGTSSILNTIVGNSTFCNAGPGIDLTNNGNADYGTGILSINRAVSDENTMIITVPANADFIDLYIADTLCTDVCTADGSGVNEPGNSQGWIYLRRVNLAPSATPVDITVNALAGENLAKVVVTATDNNGNTSEFSTCKFEPLCSAPENVTLTAPNNGEFCNGDDITITASTSTAGVEFGWIFGGQVLVGQNANTITVTEAGTYSVVIWDAADSATCNVTETIELIRNLNPSVSAIAGPDTACLNTSDVNSYTVTSTTGPYDYQWQANGATLSGSNTDMVEISQFTSQPTTITLTVTDPNSGCDTTLSYEVEVIDLPVVTGIEGEDTVQCNEAGVTYSVVNPEAGTTYSWSVPTGTVIVGSNGTDSTSITVDFGDTQGNISVIATNASGCEGDEAAVLPIRLAGCGLVADFTHTGISCVDNTIQFIDNSTFDNDPIVTWLWDFGAGAIPATATGQGPHDVTYSTNGDKDVQLIVIDAVGGSDTLTIPAYFTINENPVQPVIDGPTPICEGSTADYNVVNANQTSTFNWGVSPASSSVVDGNGTDTATVLFGDDDVTITVVETDTNGCVSPEADYFVDVIPLLGNVSGIMADTNLFCDGRGPIDDYTFLSLIHI